MAGAFSAAFSSAFDISTVSLPVAAQKGSVAGGLMFARRQLQFLALAGPILIPAPPVVVPDLSQAFADAPVRRKFDLRATHSTEYGRADPPPPAAPDLAGLSSPDVIRRIRRAQGPDVQQVVLPPGYSPDWFPSADSPVRRRRFLTHEAFATPEIRPTIPFDPAQQVATLPQPPLRPKALSAYAALSTVPPVGPPSSALTPPGVTAWTGLPNQPPAPHSRAQGQLAPAQPVSPIPQPLPPEGSWYPSAEVPPLTLKRRPWLEAFAQNIDPIDTPAYLASFWLSYAPPGPFPKRGLLASLQQALADAPPAVEIVVITGAWRPELPALLARTARRTPEAFAGPEEMATLGDAYGCMTLSSLRVTYALLLAPVVTSAILAGVVVTHATLDDLEVC